MGQIAFMIICLLIPAFSDWTTSCSNEAGGTNEGEGANE